MQELFLCNNGTELFTDWATGRAICESAFDFTLSVTFCLLQEKPFSNILGSGTGVNGRIVGDINPAVWILGHCTDPEFFTFCRSRSTVG